MIWVENNAYLVEIHPDHGNRKSELIQADADGAGEAGGAALNASASRHALATAARGYLEPARQVREQNTWTPVRGTGRGG
jgi:hypothetical protein